MHYTVTDRTARIVFDRPQRANALDLAGWRGLRDAFHRADADGDVRAVILEGEGKHFCAGIDLSVLQDMQARFTGSREAIRDQVREFITDLQDCINSIERCRKPVIAAIHGSCIGGGVDIAVACDLRYCTKDTQFSVKEVDLGIVADLGTLQRLPRIVSPGMAAELAFTARTFDGREALRIGLVNDALGNTAQLQYRTGRVADAIVAKPPRVVAGIKRTLLHQRDHAIREGLAYVADVSSALMAGFNH
ncbi:enoyl-CoA hydratase [Neolewinella xylanilytica]|uniref:Enoyl-CoA hydratase n=1 Tax=Neolewinella xylanilytica TaxID=1514080 RepID=A0A2S6I048_9BACT|nr:enoyl-CoA hydratase-related protein [Neolewinella xylanilytica]PPK84052.1 enoyl-CoA hydratase [Neolewinella xylanilytica]